MSDPNTPAVTLDLSRLGAPVPAYGSIPDGRPPGRLDNGQGGPALPTTVPVGPAAQVAQEQPHNWKKVATAGTALVATAALVAYFYTDHKSTVLARNGGESAARAKDKRKRAGKRDKRRSRYAALRGGSGAPRGGRDDEDDDENEDDDDDDE